MRHVLRAHAVSSIGNINFLTDNGHRNAARIGIAASIADEIADHHGNHLAGCKQCELVRLNKR